MKVRLFAVMLAIVMAATPVAGITLGTAPVSFHDVAATFPWATPADFDELVGHTLEDGTIRAVLALRDRLPATEDNVAAHTEVHVLLGTTPHAIAIVTVAQAFDLLASGAVTFLEPDRPLTHFMSESTVETNARSAAQAGTGMWRYEDGVLVSDHPAFSEPVTGRGVTVSIVDSGIDKTHRDFGGWDCTPVPYTPCESRIQFAGKTQVLPRAFLAGSLPDDLTTTLTDLYPESQAPTTEAASGHGTHVAGTIAGNARYTRDAGADPDRYGGDGHNFGMAPEADLVSISNGDSQWAGLGTAALAWTLDNVDTFGIKVSSNSWGCIGGCAYNPGSSTSLLVRDLHRAGVVVTFAVGNDGGSGNGAAFSGYAQSPYVLGVANYDNHNRNLAASSSRGASNNDDLPDPATWDPDNEAATAPQGGSRRPDVAAPGTGIWSARTLTGGTSSLVPRAWLDDTDLGQAGFVPYATMTGTSMSTPHVAGAAALLFDACPDATARDVMRAIMAGASPDRINGQRQGFEQGYGALDVRASVDWLLQMTECGGEMPLVVTVSDKTVAQGDEVTLSASISGGDGSTPSWQWTLTPPSTSNAALSDSTVATPSFRADTPGDYAVFLQVTVGEEMVSGGATVTAEEEVVVESTTLYLGSTGPTFIGTVDQQLTPQPLSTATPPDEGAAIAYDNPLVNNVQPDSVSELVWATTHDVTIQDQEVTATMWVETLAPLNALCGGAIDLELWNNNGGWTEIATAELVYGPTSPGDLFEVSGSFGVVLSASGPLTLVINAGSSDCDSITGIWYDDVDYPSRIEILDPLISNEPPIANAGTDQSVDEGTHVTLDGSGSTDDGTIVSYSWVQVAGSPVALSGADTASPSFAAPEVDSATTLSFELTVTDDGDPALTDTDTVDVVVNDVTVTEARVTITNPQDGSTLENPEQGLTVAGDYDPEAPLEATSQGASISLAIGWDDPGQEGGTGDYVFIDSPASGTVQGVVTLEGRAGTSPTDPDGGGCTEDCAEPFDFGQPQGHHLRPGDWSSVCTLNFVYEYLDPETDKYRYFFGSAAHCAATGSSTDTNGCITTPKAIGTTEQIGGRGIGSITATLAYSSWKTMQDVRETNSGACNGNDFALFEIHEQDLHKIHPAVRMYGGPTGLGDIDAYVRGDEMRGYGRSDLHDDTLVMDPEGSVANPKNGVFLHEANDGWTYGVYLAPQGVPGDSGGGILDIEGRALGAASTINILGWDLTDSTNPKLTLPGSNSYANIAKALEYMEANAGWAPTLVTWDEFDPNPRVTMVAGDGAESSSERGLVDDASSAPIAVAGSTSSSAGDAEDPEGDGLLPGSDIGRLGVENDDGSSFDLVLELHDGVTPSASLALRAQYEVSFTLESTGVEYQLRAQNDLLSGWSFQMWVPSQDGGFTCQMTTHVIEGSGSNEAIRFTVDYADLNVAALPTVTGTTCNAPTLGDAAAAGDRLQSLTGRSIHVIGIVNFGGELGDESDDPGEYTLGAGVEVQQVTFTVNGHDAGAAPVSDGQWSHTIDFDAFPTASEYEVVASFGSASTSVVYGSEGSCALVDRIVLTLGPYTACTESLESEWSVHFDDLSQLAEGDHELTATAYDRTGTVLDSHSITIHVAAADSGGGSGGNPGQGQGQGPDCDRRDGQPGQPPRMCKDE